MTVKILIVDDHEVVRQGIRSIIERSRPNWEICGEESNGKDAINAVASLDPDLIVLDVTMPVMSGLEAASHISRRSPRTRILIFTMHESSRLIDDIREVGAHGYVQKSQAGRDLVRALDTLLAGGSFFGSPTGTQAQTAPAKDRPGSKSDPSLRAALDDFIHVHCPRLLEDWPLSATAV
jgi:two-component system, NarL family, nitrate/nitrite response regulator NarL